MRPHRWRENSARAIPDRTRVWLMTLCDSVEGEKVTARLHSNWVRSNRPYLQIIHYQRHHSPDWQRKVSLFLSLSLVEDSGGKGCSDTALLSELSEAGRDWIFKWLCGWESARSQTLPAILFEMPWRILREGACLPRFERERWWCLIIILFPCNDAD